MPPISMDNTCYVKVTGLRKKRITFSQHSNLTCKTELNHFYVSLNRDVYTGGQQIFANIHQNIFSNNQI